MSEEQLLSLYDYLGKAAGAEIGKQVYNKAKELKIKVSTRHVSNRKYSGPVVIYPASFLELYFKK